MSTAAEFRDQLTDFSEVYASLGERTLQQSRPAVSCSDFSAFVYTSVQDSASVVLCPKSTDTKIYVDTSNVVTKQIVRCFVMIMHTR